MVGYWVELLMNFQPSEILKTRLLRNSIFFVIDNASQTLMINTINNYKSRWTIESRDF